MVGQTSRYFDKLRLSGEGLPAPGLSRAKRFSPEIRQGVSEVCPPPPAECNPLKVEWTCYGFVPVCYPVRRL